MSKKPKPNYMGPQTQEQSLEMYKPQGFYSPAGQLTWGDGGYKATLESQYDPLQTLPQYQEMRTRLLSDLGITSPERAAQLDQYGQAFLNKSLEYSAPQLKALTYGRGQAGSRMSADAYADLVSKATTESILNREQLRNLDEQLKLQQLSATESGIGNAYNAYVGLINNLFQGGQLSAEAAQQAIDNARQYVSDYNTLEAERYQRAVDSWKEKMNRIQAGVAIGAAPFTYGASLMFMPSGSLGGNVQGSQITGLFNGFQPSTTASPQQTYQPGYYSSGTFTPGGYTNQPLSQVNYGGQLLTLGR